MSRKTYISAGSNTTVLSGPGKLYGVHITPPAGATVVIVDSLNLGATPNLNSDALTGQVGRYGPYAGTASDFLDFKGAHFDDGITVAATSNARLTVTYGEG